MTTLFQSIRWRLQAWHGLILLLVMIGFCIPAYQLAMDNQLRRIDKEISKTERTLMRALFDAARGDAVGTDGDRPLVGPADVVERLVAGKITLKPETLNLFQGEEPGHAYFILRHADGRVLLQSGSVPSDPAFLRPSLKEYLEDTRTVGNRREWTRSSPHGLLTVVGRDITPELEDLRRFAWGLIAFSAGIWVLGLVGGWWLAGRAIRPIETISSTASRIAEGNLEERIDIADTDSELGHLSRVLNQTFERLHDAFERQKQFTSDASHELRTPVTILLSETQRILKRERSPEEYRDAIVTCRDTAVRMRHLIEALLLLARQENTAISAHREPCALDSVLSETVAHLAPLAAEKNMQLETDLQPAPCQADPGALAVLATNLVTNAIQHHPSGGVVRVSCVRRNGNATFTVRDDGPGIPEADLPHIFERFYRVDKARTSAAGHAGLGLAIAKTIVDNHGGTIEVKSELGQGTGFVVTLPAA